MNLQDLLAMAAKTFMNNAGSSGSGLDLNSVISALGGLLGGDDGKIDLADLVNTMKNGGLMSLANSWLGDGSNESIGADDILKLFGQGKVEGFANTLGLNQNDAVSGLQSALPELIDKASQGGDVLEGFRSQMLGNVLKGLFN